MKNSRLACLLAASLFTGFIMGPGVASAAPIPGPGAGIGSAGTVVPAPDIRDSVCDVAGVFCSSLKEIYWDVLALASFESWIPYLCAFGFIYLVYVFVGLRSKQLAPIRALKRLYPREIYLHRSSILDYRFFVARVILGPLVSLAAVVVSSAAIAASVVSQLTGIFGPVRWFEAGWISGSLYTLLLIVAIDFAIYLSHYLAHRVPLLWEFHKVHHAAEVLTPVTKSRMHPVDDLLGLAAIAGMAGIFNGVYSFVGYGAVDPVTLPGTAAVLLLFRSITLLKHSHVWLHWGWTLSHVFPTPAMHQIHHSRERRHRDKNLGRALSVWDWMFGTLYVPRYQEAFTLGLANDESQAYWTVSACYLLPFKNAARLVRDQGFRAVIPGTRRDSYAEPRSEVQQN